MKIKTLLFLSHREIGGLFSTNIEYNLRPQCGELFAFTTGQKDKYNLLGQNVLVSFVVEIVHIPKKQIYIILRDFDKRCFHSLPNIERDYIKAALKHSGFKPDMNMPLYGWEDKKDFKKHLEKASKIVETWPEWKKNILAPYPEWLGENNET